MTAEHSHNEKALLQLVADGDELAFTQLFNSYWNTVYAQALAYLKSVSLAQDIVQEVFLKVWHKRAALPAVERIDNYIFIIARNEIISQLRKKLPEGDASALPEQAPELVMQPDKQYAYRQQHQLLAKAVELLPPQRKLVFSLNRYEGLSYEEIAQQLGISRETVKGHMVKALAFVRTYLVSHGDVLLLLLLSTRL
ncbi:RNA polymerase sigma factor [Filimonas effusa]|uniref:RNA polymerase sigma factor n=1 Tax=Filimonas effusa TaxID=2508721 RepID=UPI0013E94D7C|nr:RNA polymerase sigma-70 factor [Filimonas effusa]